MSVHAAAERITQRLDALAAALREAGVAPERSARLLGAAAAATMHAVTLDVLAADRDAPPAQEHAPEPAAAEQPVTLAA